MDTGWERQRSSSMARRSRPSPVYSVWHRRETADSRRSSRASRSFRTRNSSGAEKGLAAQSTVKGDDWGLASRSRKSSGCAGRCAGAGSCPSQR